MRELTFAQNTQMGMIKGVLRIARQILYFKINNNKYVDQVIEQMKKKGAIITKSLNKDWIKIDIFKEKDLVKLGDKELNFEESTDEEIEEFIGDFYKNQYERQGFLVEEII